MPGEVDIKGACGRGQRNLPRSQLFNISHAPTDMYISLFILLSLFPKGQTFGYSPLYWLHIAV